MTKSYTTELTNDQREGMDVFELDGAVLAHLEPRQSFVVESCSAYTAYARWSAVRWDAEGVVHFTPRVGWTEPQRGKWILRLLNEGGEAIEFRTVGGKVVGLPRSVPVMIGLMLDDPLIKLKSLTITKRRVMIKNPYQPGYCSFEWRSADVLVERSANELSEIERLQQ